MRIKIDGNVYTPQWGMSSIFVTLQRNSLPVITVKIGVNKWNSETNDIEIINPSKTVQEWYDSTEPYLWIAMNNE